MLWDGAGRNHSFDACGIRRGLRAAGRAVVAGSVTAGPMCPTAQCEPLAAPGINVRLTGPNGNLDAVTDGAGRFSVIVPSGSYAVALSGTLPNNRYVTGIFADFGGPKRITVGPGSWVTL